jgi:pyridoxamine 5'-phosphate oxidase
MIIRNIRKEYKNKTLDIDDCKDNPIEQFTIWLDEAISADVLEPTAMVLSTVSESGFASSRTVLLKELYENSFLFFTNYNSRKAKHISANKTVALTFFWPELERQINIEGEGKKVSDEISDEYFKTRPYKSKISAWASNQSRIIKSKEILTKRFNMYTEKYPSTVPRPDFWGGYQVIPNRLEFWQGGIARMHDRIVYIKENENWKRVRLSP